MNWKLRCAFGSFVALIGFVPVYFTVTPLTAFGFIALFLIGSGIIVSAAPKETGDE